VGVFRGGNLTMALWEIRPYVYLLLTYLLAAALIRDQRSFRPLLWLLVLGSGAKAIQGLVIFASVAHLDPRPEAVLSHEESFFFGVYVIATLAMWLFRVGGPLRVVATALLPAVVLADMVNSRRLAWLILISGVVVVVLIALVRLKEQRRMTATVVVIGLLGGVVYLGAFWGSDGTLAQPARAIRSAIAPDDRDKASNEYRDVEDHNLRVYVIQSRGLGMGYGQQLHYQGVVDLTEDNPILAYVPHNNVLWVWVRLGLLGVMAVGILLSQSMISAVTLTQSRRREVAMVGAIVAGALVGYVAMGAKDLGFFWFRNAFAMGMLLGAVEGLLRSERLRGAIPGPIAERTPVAGSDAELSAVAGRT
jgi:O-antigen ligase